MNSLMVLGLAVLASVWAQGMLNRRQLRRSDQSRATARKKAADVENTRRNQITADDIQVAAALIESNRDIAQKAATASEHAETAASQTKEALGEIHAAVNSNLTSAQNRIKDLETTVSELINELRLSRNPPPAPAKE